jgi:hypothetical protein
MVRHERNPDPLVALLRGWRRPMMARLLKGDALVTTSIGDTSGK